MRFPRLFGTQNKTPFPINLGGVRVQTPEAARLAFFLESRTFATFSLKCLLSLKVGRLLSTSSPLSHGCLPDPLPPLILGFFTASVAKIYPLRRVSCPPPHSCPIQVVRIFFPLNVEDLRKASFFPYVGY